MNVSSFPVTEYCLIKTSDIKTLLQEAANAPEFVTEKTAQRLFDCSRDFLKALEEEGRVTPVYVSGHPKSKRWPLKQLQSCFQPL